MGGYVALNLAIQQPQLVNSIMTLGTKFDWTLESSAQEIKMLNPDIIEQKVPKFVKYLESLHGEDNWKILMVKTTQLMFNLGNGTSFKDEDLKNVKQPVLLCLGDQDTMVSQKETKTISKILPNSSLRLIQDFKHAIATIDNVVLAEHIAEYFL
jgi:pimeloyl-ACP methyl ester carboxylesterase